MPRCHMQAVQGVTAKDLKSSVTSYISSVRYMKKIVPLTVYNIIYNRVDFDENLFSDKSVCNISFKTFKSGTKNHILADVFYWCKGVADAIEKKYLREMYLLFQDQAENSIIENYKYTFAYDDEPSDNAKMPTSTDVITATRQFFNSIQSLSNYKRMSKDINILIELVLFDDVVPKDYDVTHFTRPMNPFCVGTLMNCESTPIGLVKTGYHKVKCTVKGLTFDTMSNAEAIDEENLEEVTNDEEADANENVSNAIVIIDEEPTVEDVPNFDFDDNVSVSINTNDEIAILDPDMIIDRSNFRCPCNINALIGTFETVQCTICLKYQHVICTGCINLATMTIPYICVYCNEFDRNAFDKCLLKYKPNNWKYICGIRLVINYCYVYEKAPVHLLEKLDDDVRNDVIKFIKEKKLMKCYARDGSAKINKDSMNSVMSHMFTDFHLSSSMFLEDTQDIEICD